MLHYGGMVSGWRPFPSTSVSKRVEHKKGLTVTFCSHQQRCAFQTVHVARGDVPGPTVIPLPVLIEGIDFNSSASVRHLGHKLYGSFPP